MFDAYTLLANQLADIHNQLSAKVLEDTKHAPKWKVTTTSIGTGKDMIAQGLVDDFAPLLSLVQTLKSLANYHNKVPPEQSAISFPGIPSQEE